MHRRPGPRSNVRLSLRMPTVMKTDAQPEVHPRSTGRSPETNASPPGGPPRGRPRDPRLDPAILHAAEQQLRERGYAGMTLESVAAAAGTTVPSLRRRYRDKSALVAAVIDSLRIDPLPVPKGSPRSQAGAILDNFGRNLRRPYSMALLATLLVEEARRPELIERFRERLARPRRQSLRQALQLGIAAGELAEDLDVDVAVNMLIGSFYARYVSHGTLPASWSRRVLAQLWPSRDR
jgi:AcrR family transcriptional regulator